MYEALAASIFCGMSVRVCVWLDLAGIKIDYTITHTYALGLSRRTIVPTGFIQTRISNGRIWAGTPENVSTS